MAEPPTPPHRYSTTMLQNAVEPLLRELLQHESRFLGLLLLVLAIYKMLVYPFFLSPLKDVPGPYIHRISHWPSILAQYQHKWVRRVHDLHKQYGNVVILSPTEVGLNGDRKHISELYVKNLPKLAYYENFKIHGHHNLFSNVDNPSHMASKKLMWGLYLRSAIAACTRTNLLLAHHMQHLVGAIGTRGGKCSIKQVGETHRDAVPNEGSARRHHVEVYELFGAFAMDTVTALELGLDNSTNLLNENQKSVITALRQLAEAVSIRAVHPSCLAWLIKIDLTAELWLQALYREADKGLIPSDTTYLRLVNAGYPEHSVHSYVSDNIVAGHETTALLLTYLTYELSRPINKHRQKRLHEELVAAFGNPTGSILEDFQEVSSLPYLDALLMENFRVHTLGPGSLPRKCPKDYKLPVGRKVATLPKDTILSCQQYLLHRNDRVFPSPDSWIPERWLQQPHESNEEYKRRKHEMDSYIMLFGKGVRMCLGMNFALAEIKLAVANLYWQFESAVCPHWADIATHEDKTKTYPIAMVDKLQGNSDEAKMAMLDNITTRPILSECWLQWKCLN